MVKGFYAGSFDPITYGHMFIIKTAMDLCDQVILAVGVNHKKTSFFTLEERLNFLKMAFSDVLSSKKNKLKIISFSGLAVTKAKEEKANFLLRGVRDSDDFRYEMKMCAINQSLDKELRTIFIPACEHIKIISSSMVKEIALSGGDVFPFVPDFVSEAFTNKRNSI